MAGKIFINYRRGDDPGSTTALYMRLEEEFGRGSILMDVEGYIEPGEGFARELAAQVAQCGVLLAVIGPRWADRLAARAGDPDDFVQLQIKAALDHGKPAIPILVGGASLPRAEALPEAIRALVRKGGVSLRPSEFQPDCEVLINALKRAFAAAGSQRPRPEAGRQAAEGKRQRQEAEEAAHAARTGQGKREQAPAGRTADEIRKAEELANWDFIKDSQDPEEFRDHLARFAGGPTERYARKRLEAPQPEPARAKNAGEGARPAGEGKREESEAWAKVVRSTKIPELEAFLRAWPNGTYAGPAEHRIRELQGGNRGEAISLIIMLGIVALMIGLIALAAAKF